MIQAEVQHPRALTEGDARDWRDFCAADPAFANPLLGPEFARIVGEAREDARVAVLRRDGRAIGFLPFHARPSGMAQPIGSVFSDYQALVSAPDERICGAEALAAARISGLRLSGLVDPHGVFPSAIQSELEGYVIEPGPAPEAYYAGLQQANAKRFKNWRRLQNKLEREWGEVVLTAEDRSAGALDQLIAWKRDQFRSTGAHDVFRPDWARTLFQRVFEASGDARPVLVSLRAGGKLVAGHFGLAVGRHAHAWLSATNPDCAACGPGQVLTLRLAEVMPQLGLDSYDLSPGYAHYKAPFATRAVPVREGMVSAQGRAGAAARTLNAAWALAGDRRSHTVSRLRRRFDQISAVELSAGGRMRGMVEALAGYGRRASSREPKPEAVQGEA
jgi:CelD/BcsL family acetyltransferase involved in cellulose biosynthesis